MQAATIEILETADIPSPQARAIVQAIEVEVTAHRADLATKADLLATKSELRSEIAAVRTELKLEIANMRGELRAEIAGVETRLVRWMCTLVIGQIVTVIGLGAALLKVYAG